MNTTILYKANALGKKVSKIPGVASLVSNGKRMVYQRVEAKLWAFFPSDLVIGGPFEGARFPHRSGNCSVFFPKLIGCYEAELHPVWKEVTGSDYAMVWDIGAADGYYAANFARLFPNAQVVAWEASEDAAKNCIETCKANGVENRVEVHGMCRVEDLKALSADEKMLVLCDIEGAEAELFNKEVANSLRRSDVVIELHEHLRPGVSGMLKKLFEQTHNVSLIDSVPDEQKIIKYSYDPLPRMSTILRRYATAERRYTKMQWLVATSR